MATTYVGFYRPAAQEVVGKSWRETGNGPDAFRAKIRGFPASFTPTCKMIGSWAIDGLQAPSVLVVEAESYADLARINEYYAGWLVFDWHPTGGVKRD